MQTGVVVAPSRRRAQFKKAIGLILLAGLIFAVWACWLEPDSLRLNRRTIRLTRWPSSFENFKIVAVSDLHVGAPYAGLDKMRRVVEMVNAERPDVVVLLGDYVIQDVVGGTFVPPEEFAPVLGGLRAREGGYVVLGNHDWWLDGQRVKQAFEDAGLRVLNNEVVRIERGGVGVWIAGIDDFWSRHDDIAGTLKQVTTDEPIIALNHSPDVFPKLPPRVALTLCGHTHGGQVNLPLLRNYVIPSHYGARYLAGLIEEDGRQLFVTTGVGTSTLPVRFRAAPEVAVLTMEGERNSGFGMRNDE